VSGDELYNSIIILLIKENTVEMLIKESSEIWFMLRVTTQTNDRSSIGEQKETKDKKNI
jgi:hypothetical protein